MGVLDSPCNDMLACFAQTINFGLKNGGGIADMHAQPNDYEGALLFGVVLFDWL